jgi:hypothetical protein
MRVHNLFALKGCNLLSAVHEELQQLDIKKKKSVVHGIQETDVADSDRTAVGK